MNKEQILAVLDANVRTHRSNMTLVFGISLVILPGGIVLFATLDGRDGPIAGGIVGGIGLIFTIASSIMRFGKGMEKKTEGVKDILLHTPELLVWSYVLQQNNRGAVSVNVVMNFKDGKIFQVDQQAIPEKDTTGFMQGLRSFNPGMHLGYSEELEYKFKNKTL